VRSGRLVRRWLADNPPARPPYDLGPTSCFVAYYGSAEMGCHLALGWPMPARVLDLYAEFRNLTSGLAAPHGHGLLGALTHHGLTSISTEAKDRGRSLAIRGGPFTEAEKRALLDYCLTDADALARLLVAMAPGLDLPRALLRGRYTAAAARVEWNGTPVDTETLALLRDNWKAIKLQLIPEIDKDYGVFDGTVFKHDRWATFLERRGIPWPCLDSGALDLSDDTFREMARVYPAEVGPIRELRHTLGQLRLNALAVGPDGRNRTLLGMFGSKTGRNQPSNTRSIFGPSTWLRSLIAPAPGQAVAYVDWRAQELGIAAYFSGDLLLQAMYKALDPYLFFAWKAGAVPADATKDSHPQEREVFKTVALGILYGLSAWGVARKLDVAPWQGRELLAVHQRLFPVFWRWSDAVEATAMLINELTTVFGWHVHVPLGLHPDTDRPLANPRSLRNFVMQSHGAEMMRVAACLATERGIKVCALVHDALLVEDSARLIKDTVARTQQAMREASELVLPGFPLRTDVKIIRHPDRYTDKRGAGMWDKVRGILNRLTERVG
jgi:hypothetical protein